MKYEESNYEPLDLIIPDIPSRKILMPDPIGVGTRLNEAPNSFLFRAARKYNIRLDTFIYEFVPELRKSYFSERNGKPFLRYFLLEDINFAGPQVYPLFSAFQTLSRGFDPSKLAVSLWPFGRFSDLIRPYRSWCPGCYHEWNSSGHIVYDPLIWNLSIITVCPLHRMSILTACPHCGNKLPLFSKRYQPGYCSVCRTWLGKENCEDNPPIENLKWHRWLFSEIGKIIAAPSFRNIHYRAERLFDIMKSYVVQMEPRERVFNPNRLDHYFPTLNSLLEYMFANKTSFADLYLDTKELRQMRLDFKHLVENLREREKIYGAYYYRSPVETQDDFQSDDTSDLNIYDLRIAFEKLYPARKRVAPNLVASYFDYRIFCR